MAKRTKKAVKQETPAQRLSGIIKTCRKIMRKDKGLNGDADRLPMLTWLMFLKFMDDMEQEQETKAILNDKTYIPVIESPYRWRDWAKNDGWTGDDLLNFINNENTTLPDGTEGTGLLYYLRGLQSESGKSRKDVLATVFKGLNNRMINGYLLRDVVNKIDGIHFTSNEEVNTLSLLYESLLKEMRDAAGDAGEFYTPRPVVKFMVEMTAPKLGETILDPAAGTGGFLVAAFEQMKKQAKSTDQWEALQKSTIQGGEAKPLPYLLCQMNLLLHGLEYPDIDPLNSLRFPLKDIGDSQRVDVILTNPPFGGEEERGILNNFPRDKQTSETALLFLQLIMRKLRKKTPLQNGGRAAVVVPDGTLFCDGIGARIKKDLIDNFNLHTIVRLGEGVFSPYTDIPSNLLFFEQGEKTKDIWYYEILMPDDRKKYTKTKPIQNIEFSKLKNWWNNRSENLNAWKVNVDDIPKRNKGGKDSLNLDIINPNRKSDFEYDPPVKILKKVSNQLELLTRTIESLKQENLELDKSFEKVKLSTVVAPRDNKVLVKPTESYKILGMSLEGRGLFLREEKTGLELSSKYMSKLISGDFIYSRLFAWKGAFDYVTDEFNGCYVSNEYPSFQIDTDKISIKYLTYFFHQPVTWLEVEKYCMGVTKASRNRFKEEYFLDFNIPLPPLNIQKEITDKVEQANRLLKENDSLFNDFKELKYSILKHGIN